MALGCYEVWQLSGTWLVVRGDLAWLGVLVALVAAAGLIRRRAGLTAIELMALQVCAAAVVNDLELSQQWALRDLRLYLHAGEQFLAGGSVYTTMPIQAFPHNLDQLPFLYPPPTLPVFGLLSLLPFALVSALWVAGSITAVLVALRAFGLSWRWALITLLWSPVEQGLFVGNVVVPSLLLLALAPRISGLLVLGPLLKPQNGILALWLLRERDWRGIVRGIGSLVAIIAATLPRVGIGRWTEWVAGLLAYGDAQRTVHELYGVGLARWLPGSVFLGLSALVILAALAVGRREGLARLGLASVVASPSLWSHGFLFAIPAFLRLRSPWFWFVAGLLCAGQAPGPQVALAIPVLGWGIGRLCRQAGDRADHAMLHPLGPDTMT